MEGTPPHIPQKNTDDTVPASSQTPDGQHPIVQTYEKDLALAMDATDAAVVQELLQTARDREAAEKEKVSVGRQRGWYSAAGIILIVLALAAAVYGVYYFRHLTVKVAPSASVGVFQSTDPVDTSSTEGIAATRQLITTGTLPEGKPLLVPLLSDAATRTPLDVGQTLAYLHIHASEPFIAAVSLVRLGVMNTGTNVSPFLIFSVPDPEIASKEFLIAEPDLLTMVAPLFTIDLTDQTREIDSGFKSTYMYNLPVRTLKTTDLDTKEETILLYYGYATDHTIVIATDPSILKAVYDTVIRQH